MWPFFLIILQKRSKMEFTKNQYQINEAQNHDIMAITKQRRNLLHYLELWIFMMTIGITVYDKMQFKATYTGCYNADFPDIIYTMATCVELNSNSTTFDFTREQLENSFSFGAGYIIVNYI